MSIGVHERPAVLLVEDSEADARLIVRALERDGVLVDWERVDSPSGLRHALAHPRWQLVISDSSVPGLGVERTIAIAHELAPAVPVIVVSGSLASESVPDALRAGAADFVSKDDLAPLTAAVTRALATTWPSGIARRLLAAQESVRRRIARSLHDDLGQLLLALRHTLLALAPSPTLDRALALTDDVTQRVRNVAVELWPTILDDLGLPSALRWLATRQANSALAVEIDTDEIGRLPTEIEAGGFRIAQEAITNALRHAAATTLTIRLRARPRELELTIHDDGRGFEPAAAWRRAAAGDGLGLLGMRESAGLAGGRLELDSAPGRGTVVRACFPLAGEPTR